MNLWESHRYMSGFIMYNVNSFRNKNKLEAIQSGRQYVACDRYVCFQACVTNIPGLIK